MTKPLLSIIVPVYKVEKYLDSCIQSIINQTFKNWELILIDDGSPDNCPQKCDEYAKYDNRIIVLHVLNGGQSKARNIGMKMAKGEFITFVDSDDDIEPDTYEGNIEFMINNPEVDFVQFPQKRIGWGNNFTKKTNVFYCGKKELFVNNYQDLQIDNTIWSKIYRKDSIGPVRFREGHVHEDKLFILELIKRVNVVYISNIGGYNYYKREGSTLNTYTFSKLEDWIYTELETLDYMYEFKELEKVFLSRWMYNVRMLMNVQKEHHDWIVLPLLNQLVQHKPRLICKNNSLKNVLSYIFISIFGMKMYYKTYSRLLNKKQ